jgi:hypothetical protein
MPGMCVHFFGKCRVFPKILDIPKYVATNSSLRKKSWVLLHGVCVSSVRARRDTQLQNYYYFRWDI